ncbi:MAG: cytochrome c5 family protein [Gammaproteobacteria bacterium]|nr:MAG: cytochrome c5 family protein [Gammaproteobacteria bacterium]RLA53081.1 MAG: cytochrome c5 family protein [Gammaproteobacteria bacterium]
MKQSKLVAVSAVFITALVLGACSGEKEEVKLTAQQETEMSERLAPDGEVALASEVASAPVASTGGSRSGEDVYNSKCTTCHASGAAGAPILGATEDWGTRAGKGIDTLYTSAISGFNGMPAKGLCMDCSDDELKAAVDYMVENSQ